MDNKENLPLFSQPSSVDTPTALLTDCINQAPQAWEKIVKLYGSLINYWMGTEIPVSEREDVYQNILLSIFQSLPSFRKENQMDKFRKWLRVIVKRRVADFYTQDKHQRGGLQYMGTDLSEIENQADFDPMILCIENKILQEQLVALLKKELPEKEWQILYLSILENKSPSEIAAILNLTQGNVRTIKYRLLKKIQQEYADCLS